MGWIIMLIALGVILFVAELVLLPGITIAAVGAFCCLVGAVTWAFVDWGPVTGFIILGIVLVVLLILMLLFLRPKTWNRVSLKTNINSQVDELGIEKRVEVGMQGTSLTRLAPMGKVDISGEIYEAKSLDCYIDPRSEIVVTGYDNNTLIVRQK